MFPHSCGTSVNYLMGTYSSKEISAEEERDGIPARAGAEVKTDDPVYPTYLMVRLSLSEHESLNLAATRSQSGGSFWWLWN